MRISVSGGGCSGFKYNFEMSKDQDDSDVVLTKNNAIIILDDLSYHSFLKGSTLDYQQDLSGAAFVITNPNSSAKCGCGNSFAI